MGRVCPCSRSRAKQIACVSLHVVVVGLFHDSNLKSAQGFVLFDRIGGTGFSFAWPKR